MSISKIDICNISLATIGADSIRSFEENNIRARMCDVFFDYTRDYLLSKFDWTFARKGAILVEVVSPPKQVGWYSYQLPPDCMTPRDIMPEGSREQWYVMEDRLYTRISPEQGAYLHYTFLQTNTSKFSNVFANLLALGIATRICPPISQDKRLTATLYEMYQREVLEVSEVDANIGNNHPTNDNDPNLDSFVTPGALPTFSGFE